MNWIVDLFALGVAIWAVVEARTARQQQLAAERRQEETERDLKRLQEDLLRYQLDRERTATHAAQRAEVYASVLSLHPSYRLLISNRGPSDAYEVDVELVGVAASDERYPFFEAQIQDRLPAGLRPGEEVRLTMAFSSTTGSSFDAILRWRDGSGRREEQIKIHP